MPTKTVPIVHTIDNDADALSIRFYISDVSSGKVPRLEVVFSDGSRVDRPVSDFSSLTNPQKVALRASLLTLRNECMTLEGYT